MNSQKEILNMVLTEALEADVRNTSRLIRRAKRKALSVKYNLRLVREKDGSLKWED